MNNDRLSREEAQKLIEQRMEEAEAYSRQKQLGYGDSQTARWIFLLFVIVVVVTVGLLL
jgi:hypothetical protein